MYLSKATTVCISSALEMYVLLCLLYLLYKTASRYSAIKSVLVTRFVHHRSKIIKLLKEIAAM